MQAGTATQKSILGDAMASGIRLTATVTGAEKIKQMLKRHQAKAIQALKRELYQEAEGIMSQAKEFVPVDTGTLKDSGTVRLPREEGGSIVQELGFGGAAADYAVYVHENTLVFHKVGMAKFLEIPFRQAEKGLAERVAAGMQKTLRG